MEEDDIGLDVDTQDPAPEPVLLKPNLDVDGFGKAVDTDNFPGLVPTQD